MNAAAATLVLPGASPQVPRWVLGIAVGLLAAAIGALQFAPAGHAAVFPFAAMSLMGLVLLALVLGDRISLRKGLGIAVVLAGLVQLSGVEASSFTTRAAQGDAMFVAAGTLWAGFGILLRKHRLGPLLTTAVVSLSALVTYVPVYLVATGGASLLAAMPAALWTEVLVQGLIAGAGTLFTCAKMVSLLGPSKAAIFPALAPGLSALLAWPVLGYVPTPAETAGLVVVITGLVLAVTCSQRR